MGVRRELTPDELQGILVAIGQADSLSGVVLVACRETFNALLSDVGMSWDSFDESNRLNPTDYAIPQPQLSEIFDAAGKRSRELATRNRDDAAFCVLMELVNIGPSHYTPTEVRQ